MEKSDKDKTLPGNKPISQRRIYHYLDHMTHQERKRFLDYAMSPYFNDQASNIPLLEAFLKAYETGPDSPEWEPEHLWTILYPERPYNRKSLNTRISNLTVLCEHFLTQQRWESEKGHHSYRLLQELHAQGLHQSFDTRMRKLHHEMENWERDDEYYEMVVKVKNLECVNQFSRNTMPNGDPFSGLMGEIHRQYQFHRLKSTCAWQDWREKTGKGARYPLNLSENGRSLLNNDFMLEIYSLVAQILLHQDEPTPCRDLVRLLYLHHELIGKEQLGDLFSHALTYFVKKVNQGLIDYRQELLEIYLQMERIGIWEKLDHIRPVDYRNWIHLLTINKDFEAAGRVLEQYKYKLPKENEDFYEYSHIALLFETQAYKKIVELHETTLHRMKAEQHRLHAWGIMIKSIFELWHQEGDEFWNKMLENNIRRFNRHLKKVKSRLAKDRFDRYQGFTRLLKTMLNNLQKPMETQSKGRNRILERVENAQNLYSKKWLEAKLKRPL